MANGLIDALPRERVADGAVVTEPSVLGLRETDANSALIERAKGALMLFYGVDSHQALAVLVGWARMSRTPVRLIADTLLRGICEGNPQTEVRQRPLIRWLEAQLRDGDPGRAQLLNGTGPPQPAHETPRSG
jgi:hypothetical protein